jgi:outer membrane protein OmpA-like peptidoglycan-associated protein
VKLIVITIGLCLGMFGAFAQKSKNLVPNPSFEEYSQCPTAYDQIDRAKHWKKYRGTPDLFNSCSRNREVKVPQNFFGYAHAPTGGGYGGLVSFHKQTPNEVMGVELIEPLQRGKTYKIGFKMCFGYSDSGVATNNMGLLFTNDPASDTVARKAHVKAEEIITEQDGWKLIEGTFNADKEYKYLIVGNLFLREETKSVSRPVGLGSSVYYYIDDVFVEEVYFDPTVSLTGNFVDEDTKKPIQTTITYQNVEKPTQKGTVQTDKNGNYEIKVTAGTYDVEISSKGYYPTIERVKVEKAGKIPVKETFTPLKKGKTIVLKHIYFGYNDVKLQPESFKEMDLLVKIMKENPIMEILISGHTDDKGKHDENIVLSKTRAEAVQVYLKKTGISEKRMKTEGLGETKPISPNTTEENRALNRRVEFRIVTI